MAYQEHIQIDFGDKEYGCYKLEAMTYDKTPKTKAKHALMAQFRKSHDCNSALDTYVKKQDEDRFIMAMYISQKYAHVSKLCISIL